MASMIQASARIVDDVLWLPYRVTNTTGQMLYLFNWLPNPDRRRADCVCNKAYVSVHPSAAVLFLQGWIPQFACPPDGPQINLFQPVRPWATRLRPGHTFEGVIQMPLPLREWDAYVDQPDDSVPARWVELNHGAMLIDALLDADKFDDAEEVADGAWNATGFPIERLKAEFKLPGYCPVQVRQDGFQRFSPAYVV